MGCAPSSGDSSAHVTMAQARRKQENAIIEANLGREANMGRTMSLSSLGSTNTAIEARMGRTVSSSSLGSASNPPMNTGDVNVSLPVLPAPASDPEMNTGEIIVSLTDLPTQECVFEAKAEDPLVDELAQNLMVDLMELQRLRSMKKKTIKRTGLQKKAAGCAQKYCDYSLADRYGEVPMPRLPLQIQTTPSESESFSNSHSNSHSQMFLQSEPLPGHSFPL
mmetsp:Transcript_88781/g.167342  ORF Transcript_88781/g.167342 Transcript_88781/m.167342 type:complete len:222 (+) Transcript_88781:40-705(+)